MTDDMRELDPAEAADGETDPVDLAQRPEATGPQGTERTPQSAGRLVEPEAEDQPDITAEMIASQAEREPVDLTAEEAAVHIEAEN